MIVKKKHPQQKRCGEVCVDTLKKKKNRLVAAWLNVVAYNKPVKLYVLIMVHSVVEHEMTDKLIPKRINTDAYQ